MVISISIVDINPRKSAEVVSSRSSGGKPAFLTCTFPNAALLNPADAIAVTSHVQKAALPFVDLSALRSTQ
jgi:hypothetical protein